MITPHHTSYSENVCLHHFICSAPSFPRQLGTLISQQKCPTCFDQTLKTKNREVRWNLSSRDEEPATCRCWSDKYCTSNQKNKNHNRRILGLEIWTNKISILSRIFVPLSFQVLSAITGTNGPSPYRSLTPYQGRMWLILHTIFFLQKFLAL